jgi:hypothetical protein
MKSCFFALLIFLVGCSLGSNQSALTAPITILGDKLSQPAGLTVFRDTSIDAQGYSGEQLVLLACGDGSAFSKHGHYVSCVTRRQDAAEAGLLTYQEKAQLVREAHQ